MDYNTAKQTAIEALSAIYPAGEAMAIAKILLESPQKKFEEQLSRLLQQEPIQYVLNEAWFYNQKFYVDRSVLIPRPETEELVHWILSEQTNSPKSIIDIGTGSGCIAISLKKHLSLAQVTGIEISENALIVAKKNATDLNTAVDFLCADIFENTFCANAPQYDIIVSNPPYISQQELENIEPNVVNFEPHLALFVPAESPVIFYHAIARFARQKLKPGGAVYVELDKKNALKTVEAFSAQGFKTILKKDIFNNDRMLKAYSD